MRVVALVKNSYAPRTRENIRLLAINPLLIRVLEAVVKKRLAHIVADEALKKSLMEKTQLEFILGGICA